MKTIREWLNELPLKYRILAFRNTHSKNKDIRTDSLYNAVCNAFVWEGAIGGEYFWSRVYDALRDKKQLPRIR